MTQNKQKNTKQPKLKTKPTMRELNTASSRAMGRSNNSGLFSGKISPEQSKELMKAFDEEDWKKAAEIQSQIKYDRGYINCPDLKFSEGSSVQNLQVTLYSSSTKDQKLLHRLLKSSD